MDPEVQRLINILRTVMRVLGVTNQEIERRLGQSPDDLSRVFAGDLELKAEHLIQIPRAMGMQPAEFFHLAYPKTDEPASKAAVRLRDSLEYLQIPIAEKQPEITDEQLQKMVTSALEKMLESIHAGKGIR
jgi:predicted DNA-binding protein (UPF0251 family)